MMERTLVVAKPDAVKNNNIGEMIRRFEAESLKVVALKMKTLSKEASQLLYREHCEKSFFNGLVESTSSGPVALMVLEGKDAISKVRGLMGTTDPKKAMKGTIRHDMGTDIGANAVHGSDSSETAAFEIPLFFSSL